MANKHIESDELLQTLMDLLKNYSPSIITRDGKPNGMEIAMRDHLVKILQNLGMTCDVSTGNLVATRGEVSKMNKAPMICAHMDTSIRNHLEDKNFSPLPCNTRLESLIKQKIPVIEKFRPLGTKVRRYLDEALEDYTSPPDPHYFWCEDGYLGLDDKVGIAMALCIAKRTTYPLRLVFTYGEERGRLGIKKIKNTFYEGISFAIVIDRHGSRDLVIEYPDNDENGEPVPLCSSEFGEQVRELLGLTPVREPKRCADAMNIRKISNDAINVVNVAMSIFGEHCAEDYMVIEDAHRILEKLVDLINNHASELSNIPAA